MPYCPRPWRFPEQPTVHDWVTLRYNGISSSPEFEKAQKGHMDFRAPYRVNKCLWSTYLSPNSPCGLSHFLPFSSKVSSGTLSSNLLAYWSLSQCLLPKIPHLGQWAHLSTFPSSSKFIQVLSLVKLAGLFHFPNFGFLNIGLLTLPLEVIGIIKYEGVC